MVNFLTSLSMRTSNYTKPAPPPFFENYCVLPDNFDWFSFIGLINDEFLKECLMTMGERWSEDMVEDLFHGAPIHNGLFDYKEFTRTLKHGSRDKEDDQVPSIPPEELAFKPSTST